MTTLTHPGEGTSYGKKFLAEDKPHVHSACGSRSENEDRHLVLRLSIKNHGVREDGWLLAVMDGHGGPQAAEAAKHALPAAFQNAFRAHRSDMQIVMRETVATLSEDPSIKYQVFAGTTISMAFITPDQSKVYVAHLGDSPVIMFDSGGHIVFRTDEHNVITNPREVEVARRLSKERHGEDRIVVTERPGRDGELRPKYVKDRRMDDEFDEMFNELMDLIEQRASEAGQEYSIEDSHNDGKRLARLLRGKGIQNTAQLGAHPFEGIVSREPDVSEVMIDPTRLPVYLMLATDGILDVDPHADLPDVERDLAHAVAVDGAGPRELVEMAGGLRAHDNTTVILFKIPEVHHHSY